MFLLHPNQIFLLNSDEPAALDGRHFGAFPAEIVIGRAVPIWTRVDD
jgi:type IV secretory pathway protease TraF